MKKPILFGLLIIVLVTASLLAACSKTTSTTTTTSVPTKTTQPPAATTTATSAPALSTSAPAPGPTTSVAPASQGNWWYKFEKPQYGGTLTYSVNGIMGVNWDVYTMVGAEKDLYYEALFEPDWTLDRKIWSMTGMFYPDEVLVGHLAQSWDINDLKTITVHLRQGVKWQNKAPANGREFVASDVEAHYTRILGLGNGYTAPSPMFAGTVATWESVKATDKYTVVFKFKTDSAQHLQAIADRWALNEIECPDWVKLGGDVVTNAAGTPLADWKTTIGTGGWMFTDYVSSSAYTWSKNPDYWGFDPRYPNNETPYADKLVMLVIGDASTRLAALRTGKIIYMDGLTWQQSSELKSSNPEIAQVETVAGASGIGLRVDHTPFRDIRVRRALDMAIDRTTIAKGFYNGASTGLPCGFISTQYKGYAYAYAYADWPQSLKDEYAFNPTAAKALLKEAGFPNGFDTNCVTTSDTATVQALEVMKAYFADIGVNMEIRAMESAAEQSFVRAGKHDQMSGQGGGATFPPTRTVDVFYSTGGTDAVFFGLDKAPDHTYDKLHDEFMSALDSTSAKKILQQMDAWIISQHYFIGAPESYSYTVWIPQLKGYSGESLMWGAGIDFGRLWLTK